MGYGAERGGGHFDLGGGVSQAMGWELGRETCYAVFYCSISRVGMFINDPLEVGEGASTGRLTAGRGGGQPPPRDNVPTPVQIPQYDVPSRVLYQVGNSGPPRGVLNQADFLFPWFTVIIFQTRKRGEGWVHK